MTATRSRLIRVAEAAEAKYSPNVRRKCFLSYHRANSDEVASFIERFDDVFIPKVIGVSEDDPFVDSDDDAYVLSRIQRKYMWDSTVTIVLIGRCTWSRKFVDWEIFSSLRNDLNNKRNGLTAIQLPSVDGSRPKLPPRLSKNLPSGDDDGYARYWRYPQDDEGLRSVIEDAFTARTSRAHLIKPADSRARVNRACS